MSNSGSNNCKSNNGSNNCNINSEIMSEMKSEATPSELMEIFLITDADLKSNVDKECGYQGHENGKRKSHERNSWASRRETATLDEEEQQEAAILDPSTTIVTIPVSALTQMKTETAQRTVDTCCFCFKTCQLADDEFRLHLLIHLEAYRGKAFCPVCRADCTSYERMIDHFLMVHGKMDKLVCSFANCIRSFRTQRTLELHEKKHM